MSEQYPIIPQEKFEFVNDKDRLHDKVFDDKPVSYFKDAWIRFRKNRASVVATVIIIIIVLYAFLMPLVNSRPGFDAHFLDNHYAKKAPRALHLRKIGIADGGQNRDFSDKSLITKLAIGVGAEDTDPDNKPTITLQESLTSYYQPVLSIGEPVERRKGKNVERSYTGRIDVYLEEGFFYMYVPQEEYARIREWEEENGLHVLYPLIDTTSKYFPSAGDAENANYWYKMTNKYAPYYVNEKGKLKNFLDAKDNPDLTAEGLMQLVLEDNYKRDADGNLMYYEYSGGGDYDTAQYKVRVLYYNYYRYKNGFEPNYLFGTDLQGYDLSLRMADGIKLSLLVAICVSVINFIIGAMYGAVEGYYGGWLDIILERITEILSGIPFIILATLFQIHLAAKVGPVPSLLFAYVVTGWIGTAYRVRTQFYRFKNQEYVMAARTLGARDRRIIWKHIFPNTLGTIITSSALVIPGVINSESMLSYLGIVKLGSAKTTSLGTLLADASSKWTSNPHLMIFPAAVLSLLMICFNLFGNGLRDAFNPSLRGVED